MKPKTSTTSKPSAAKREPDWLDWEDSILNHCRNLETLAELLAHTGRNNIAPVTMVNDTGGLMKEELARLKQQVQARPGRGAK